MICARCGQVNQCRCPEGRPTPLGEVTRGGRPRMKVATPHRVVHATILQGDGTIRRLPVRVAGR